MPRRRKPHDRFRWFDSSPEVIRLLVMMYVRSPLSLQNVEDLLHERGIDICHETPYWAGANEETSLQSADCFDEALVGVGREVDRERRVGRARLGHLDVQRHLAVGARVHARRGLRAVDPHSQDHRCGEARGLERSRCVRLRNTTSSSMSAMVWSRPWPAVEGKPFSLATAFGRWAASAAWGRASYTDLGVATGRWSSPSTASTTSATSAGAESVPARARRRPFG